MFFSYILRFANTLNKMIRKSTWTPERKSLSLVIVGLAFSGISTAEGHELPANDVFKCLIIKPPFPVTLCYEKGLEMNINSKYY